MDEHDDALSRDDRLSPVSLPLDAVQAEIASLRQAEQRYRLVADLTWDWEFWMTSDQTMAYTSPSCERISGYSPSFFDSCSRFLEIVDPNDRPALERELCPASETRTRDDYLLRITLRDGTARWVSLAYRPVHGTDGTFLGVRGSIRDISARKQMEASLESRLRQQAAVAQLGEIALSGVPLDRLLDEAANCVAETIGVEYSSIAELLPGGRDLLVRAGTGWHEGIVGVLRLGADDGSQSGYSLQFNEPIVVQDWAGETRFRPGPQLAAHGVVSSATVIIHGQDGPFGTLGVFSRQRRLFAGDDIHYLQSVANVLGMAIARQQAEQARDRAMAEQTHLLAENQQQRAFLERLFEAMSDAVIVYDADRRLVQANKAAIAGYGFDPTSEDVQKMARRLVLRRPGGQLMGREEIPAERALRGEVVPDERMVLTSIQGEERTIIASAAPLRTDGEVSGAVVIWHDVTESAAEAAHVERLAAELEAIITAVPGGLAVYDASGRIVRLNQAAKDRLGYGKADLGNPIGERAATVRAVQSDGRPMPPDELPAARALRGETVEFCTMGFQRLGEDRTTWVSASAAPVLDAAGRPAGAVSSFADITPLREMEARLLAANRELTHQAEELEVQAEELRVQNEESEKMADALAAERAMLAAIFQNAPEGIVVADAKARVLRTNPAADRIYARPVPLGQDFESHAVLRLCLPDGTPYPARDLPLTRSALDGETLVDVEMAIVWPDGQRRDLLINSAPIRDESGRVTGAVGVFQDVSGRKAAEREREQLLAELQVANQRLKEQAEEMEVQTEELQVQNRDLTDLMRELEAQRGRLEAVIEQMPGGVVIAEAPSGRVVMVNRRTEELLRGPYPPPDGPDEYMRYATFYPDGRTYPPAEMPLARAVRGETVSNEEIHYVRGDGSRAVQVVSAQPVRDHKGDVTAGVIVFIDITQRKVMEDELARARDELEQRVEERTAALAQANQALQYQAYLLANINDAVVATDAEGRITAWNRAAEQLYGWTIDEVAGHQLDEILEPRVIGVEHGDVRRALLEMRRLRGEAVHHRRDGAEIVVESTSMALSDAQGQISGYVSVNRDVTRRKQAEAALRESEERYRVVSDLTSDYVYRLQVNPDGTMVGTLVTDGFTRLTGFTLDQVKDMDNWRRFIHPDDLASTGEFFDRVISTGLPASTEIRMQTTAGGVMWTNLFARPRWDAALGRVIAVEGAVKDITERVQARRLLEQRVTERTRELSTLLAVSNSVASKLEIGPLLSAMADQLQQVVSYSGLIVYELQGDELEVTEYRGPVPREEALHLRVPVGATVGLEAVVRQREPVIIGDIEGDSPLARAWQQSVHPVQVRLIGGARSWLGVPIVIKERVIGVLRLGHDEPEHFSPHHAALAMAFASHAAVAMENARLYRQAGALAALEERQRLARDLHDAVSQILFSASLTADVLPALYNRDSVHGQELLRELRELNRGAMAEMRMLLLELRPAALLEVDLATLLRHLGEAASARARLKVTVAGKGPGRLPSDVQVALYRIAQEAMNNVIKHAQATSVMIEMSVLVSQGENDDPTQVGGSTTVAMSIVDDGRGFDPSKVERHRLGLGIMAERAAAIGAVLTVDSEPGKGTVVKVVWKIR